MLPIVLLENKIHFRLRTDLFASVNCREEGKVVLRSGTIMKKVSRFLPWTVNSRQEIQSNFQIVSKAWLSWGNRLRDYEGGKPTILTFAKFNSN